MCAAPLALDIDRIARRESETPDKMSVTIRPIFASIVASNFRQA
jgi:hypothetical protein